METRERLVLRKNRRFLIDNIDIKAVVDGLYESNVLNTDDQERIQAEVVTGDRVEKLLKILPRKCKSYQPLLASVDEHIRKHLQSCEISPEEISKEDQHLDDFVRDILKEICCVEEKSKVTVSALEDEVRQQIIASGIEYRLTQGHLQALVLSTFCDVALGKRGGRRERTAVYKNLSWRQKDLVSDGNDSGDEEAHESQTHSRLRIEEMNAEELCHVLEEFNPDANRLDPKILTIFKNENVDGKIFKFLIYEETKEILPGFSFRDRKNLLITRDELIRCERAGELDASIDRPGKEKLKVKNTERKAYFRESFRKFETPVGNLDNYRKSAVIRTSITRPHNLIEPVHLFLSKDEGEKIRWIAEETVRFASACMNERTNGTIHFGVERKANSDCLEGEIVGIEVEKDSCKEALYQAITSHFYEDQIELALKCIRPVEFIEVSSVNQHEQNLVVVEVDIIPNSTLVQDEAVYVTFEEGMVLYRFMNDDPHPSSLTEEQTRQYMKSKKELAQYRKQQEQIPKTVPIQEDLRQNFLNLFSGGCETLAEEIYPIIFLSPLECSTDLNFTENFQFVNDIEPCIIFDFDSSSGANGMYNFIEVEKEQVVKVLTTENFDRNSEENKTDHDRRNHLFDDLKTSALRPWVFCNGYDVMEKEPMIVLDWKRKRSEGFKEALRFYGEEIPNGRAMVIFLLLSKNYDVLLEAAEEVILKFQDQWMLLAPTEDIANSWISELLRRQSIDRKTMSERCIVGLPWNHVNIMLQQLVSTDKRGSCEIATSKGAFCCLRDKVRNEMYDLEILSRKECDDTEIANDPEKVEKHSMETQESFFRGVQVTWWNYWFGSDHVLLRSQHPRLMDILTNALNGKQNDDDCRVAIVNLIHQPGAGGTTSARQLLWDLREKYRCCIVKQITDQTCDQIALLRNYEDPSTPKPPIILLDNCDEENVQNLYASLENRARLAAKRSETTPFPCFCVLLLCTRRTNLPTKTDKSVVLLKHELEPRELEWFNKKYESLEQKYQNENGVNPRLLISFNILKENFNQEYITRTVQQYVDSIESELEKYLLLYLAMMNSYDIDFKSIPISAFDTMMSTGSNVISFGLVSPQRQRLKRRWESHMSSSLQVLLNRSSRGGLGTNLRALSIINKLFAREIFKFLQAKLAMETSGAMLSFLHSPVFDNQNRSVEQVKKIVKDILKKREQLENGTRAKFSPMLVEICLKEDPDKAAAVLLKGFRMTLDPMIAQQIARFYISCKNWEEAIKYSKIATQMKPNSSYLWDTFGLVYKNQLQQKYECCLQQGTKLSMNETRDVIQLASTGIDIFHKEQSVSEQEKNASTNDAGYYNEVYLVILLLDLLKVSSPIDRRTLHTILVDRDIGYEKISCSDLDKETFEYLRTLRLHTDAAMRKLEDKITQLKDSAMKNAHLGKSGFAYRSISHLRENVDSYFGEDTDEVPEYLSQKDKTDFRRRRIRKLGGRSLANILALRRDQDGERKLRTIFSHLQANLGSENVEAFDIKSFISVALVMHITNVERCPYPFEKLVELSKRLYTMQNESQEELPYLEVFLYLMMLHWPTECRKHLPLYPIGKLPDAMKNWKIAFQRNHPRQMSGNPYRMKRETTYFFLGKGEGYDEIVYYEELHGSHMGRYFKGDTVWSQQQTIDRLKRLEGILINDGTDVSVQIETAGGNKTHIVIPTGTHIGQRTLWQKRVYFYLGFTWSGPKAFDVTRDDRKSTDQVARCSSHFIKPKGRNIPLIQEPDVAQQIVTIHDSLRKIDQLKIMRGWSSREKNLIKQEPELRRNLAILIKRRQDFFEAPI
ncbi:sterile alpha motif domain-containing protein 9-like [Mizuhopecten yessoensis]|uniref:sterile alpha motif domain-containing protein 9-like n=1 Tax=Mizuhopecten yessoensis TaxID=6573 RepID=UPI000B45C59D|nr:sterile alpha motif domain-containing protein 9-like [Mizuhopecten yessoensis]